MTEDEFYALTEEEMEAAFKEAKADLAAPETQEMADDEVDTDSTESSDLEQSDYADSDHDGEDADNADEAEEDSDEDEVSSKDSDGNTEDTAETDEEQTDEGKEAEEDSEQPAADTFKFKADGKEYSFDRKEIMEQFPKVFAQAMNYTRKMQAIKPWRKTMDAMEEAKLSHEDVNLMIDVLKGDKGAIAEVLKRTGTDTLDLDIEGSKYVANDYGRDENALALKEVLDDITEDVEYKTTHSILTGQWDKKSLQELTSKPDWIKGLHVDVKSGMFNTIQPIADKLKVLDGAKKTDLEYYKEASQDYWGKVRQKEMMAQEQQYRKAQEAEAKAEAAKLAKVKAQEKSRQDTKQAASKRKAAAPTKVSTRKADSSLIDDSDEGFEAWYAELQKKM